MDRMASGAAVTLKVPYEVAEQPGGSLNLAVDPRNLVASFCPHEQQAIPDLLGRVADAVENPIGGKKLSEILAGARKVTIITENQYRQAPAHKIVPWLLERIRQAGAKATIVIGTARQAPLTAEQIREKLGDAVVNSGVEIHCNELNKPENYEYKGTTSFGIPLWIHRQVAEADAIITLATTQATLWGYGGSGMIIPAVAGRDTIEYDHFMSLAPDCMPGNNECKMQFDKYEAARMAGVSMGINTIVNNQSETTYVNAGDFVEAHKESVKVYDHVYRFDASALREQKADIVITGSTAATDHLFYHTCWAILNCLPIVKKGGTILFAAPCPGFHGLPGFAFFERLIPHMPATEENLHKAIPAFYEQSSKLRAAGIRFKIYNALINQDLRIVTLPQNHEFAHEIGFNVYDDIRSAYRDALALHGSDARVAFVPYGRYSVLDLK
jgi:nickel-dependent lactate racemase